jgi:hypothetical protein
MITCSIHPEGTNPIYGEGVTTIKIDDESCGGFIVLSQETGTVSVTIDELQHIARVAKEMIDAYDMVVQSD